MHEHPQVRNPCASPLVAEVVDLPPFSSLRRPPSARHAVAAPDTLSPDVGLPTPCQRLLIHRTLLAIQAQDYPQHPVDERLRAGVPGKEETPGDIDARVRAWDAWWGTVRPAAAAAR